MHFGPKHDVAVNVYYKANQVMLAYDKERGPSFSIELTIQDARKMAMRLIRSCDKAEQLGCFSLDDGQLSQPGSGSP